MKTLSITITGPNPDLLYGCRYSIKKILEQDLLVLRLYDHILGATLLNFYELSFGNHRSFALLFTVFRCLKICGSYHYPNFCYHVD